MNRSILLAALGTGGWLAYRAMKPRYRFAGKHVLITGGSRGLGLVLARQLAAAGARLSICSRDFNELARAEAELVSAGARVVASECDVTDRARVGEFVALARYGNGPIDVLVNNAGVIRVGPVEEMQEEDFEQSLRTHFWAALYTTFEVLPEMKARGTGRIVNIASIGGKVAVPHLLPYSVSKFALVGFSDGLRAEVARHGVVVTTVCPGLMRTGSHVNAEFKGRHEEEYAWFAVGDGLPGLSMSAEAAARRVLAGCARGDAEVVLGLPAKLAVLARAVGPGPTAAALAFVNRHLPDPGGIGRQAVPGRASRGKLPPFVTTLIDRAAERNNEGGPHPKSTVHVGHHSTR
jgi:NAD(P)-dependent dehydrogenase (short-subunit alcohol dehydrogenase family)